MDPLADSRAPSSLAEAETVDAILRGRLRLVQPKHGQRLTTDPIFLADFVRQTVSGRRICDLGAGTGALALILAHIDPRCEATGIEIDPHLVKMAHRNARLNQLEDRVRFIAGDLRSAGPNHAFDLVVSNPPYFALGAGRSPVRKGRASAHHEAFVQLGELTGAARRLLRPKGRLALIYPAERLDDLVGALGAHAFGLRALRFVHPRPQMPAIRVLLAAQQGGASRPIIHPPLVLHEGTGWSAEATRILGGADAPGDLPAPDTSKC